MCGGFHRLALLGVLLLAAVVPAAASGSDALGKVRDLRADGRYEEAEAAARALLAEVEAESGPESLPVAEVLDELVNILWRAGRAREPETFELARRAADIKTNVLDPDDPELAKSLTNLANLAKGRAAGEASNK